MKTLSLYIDRWYIAAAVCYDNIPRRIDLPNREDRIWLYFYEDINNDRVIYGKSYQKHYLDKELHYYGDIFSKVVKEDETFKRFGKDVSLKEIFKASDILEHLTRDFNENEKIDTYISFSVDVSYAAQKVFLDILEENNFVIKESVARISHLAVELSNKKGLLNDSNCILVETAEKVDSTNVEKTDNTLKEESTKATAEMPSSESNSKQSSKPDVVKVEKKTQTSSAIPVNGSLEQKAIAVIRGTYGNGLERKQKLGDEYTVIQNKVNEMYRDGLVD